MVRPGRPILCCNIFKLVTRIRILDPMIFRAFPVKALESSANLKSISYASAAMFRESVLGFYALKILFADLAEAKLSWKSSQITKILQVNLLASCCYISRSGTLDSDEFCNIITSFSAPKFFWAFEGFTGESLGPALLELILEGCRIRIEDVWLKKSNENLSL